MSIFRWFSITVAVVALMGLTVYGGLEGDTARGAPTAAPATEAVAGAAQNPSATALEDALLLLGGDASQRQGALARLASHWHVHLVPMVLEVTYLTGDAATRAAAIDLLQRQTGQSFGFDLDAWYQWLWRQDYPPHPRYAEFKAVLYGLIDERFRGYFSPTRPARIRLDEVRWGGVRQDGIPPLRNPAMVKATEADYLQDHHIVFGIAVSGDVRAYPKRILAWHEMFTDTVGGVPVAGVYCTLCGTVILYDTVLHGTPHQLGTSGFLYRSNKLMYDRATQSLWNTLWGEPVIGPLADSGIALERRAVVTTTWGEWRRRHPDTLVLSLATGHRRDYSEGAAYRDYFATDELMFTVPFLDRRLANKAEVLGLVFPREDAEPLAIASAHLQTLPVYRDRLGDIEFTVLTDRSGAHRVYHTGKVRLVTFDGDVTATAADGSRWTLDEATLTAADGRTLARLPSQRAFWFGWLSAYPRTRLVH